MRVRLKLKQLTDRARLAVAARKHEPRAVLVPCVETLNTERTQFHDVQYRARFPGYAIDPAPGRDGRSPVTGAATGQGLFGPDGLAVRGLAGPPALGEPGYKEKAASVLVQGTRAAEERGGAAAVGDLADERPVPDETKLDRALGVPDRVGYEFADHKP